MITKIVFLVAAAAIAVVSGKEFLDMHAPEPIYAGPGVSKTKTLGDYAPVIAGGPAETPVYILEGEAPGGTLVLLGGTHPQEVSGLVAATVVIENIKVKTGRVIVIPQANRSGFTFTEPLEGFPHHFEIETAGGPRWFRYGMRVSNPIHQWPDPELQVHSPSREFMVGWEARNLNRNYPGDPNGRYTERVGHAITQVVKGENASLVLDMHEAYPEYPIINMIVAHQRAFEIGTMTALMLQSRGIKMDIMASPENLHGLSHREFGDHSPAFALLSETASASMGRFRGRTDAALVTEGVDANYEAAGKQGRLFVEFGPTGHPLKSRVARNLATIEEMLAAYNEANPSNQIVIDGLPTYDAVMEKGIGAFLTSPQSK